MTSDVATLLGSLKQLVKACEFDAAAKLVDQMIAAVTRGDLSFDAEHRKKMLGALRGARQFDAMGRMAQALMLAGHDDPANAEFDPLVRRQYAQSLIEAGQLASAIDTLLNGLGLIAGVPADSYAKHLPERHEINGLLGRAHKQLYVEARAREASAGHAERLLEAAGHWYHEAVGGRTQVQAHWPLINMIAMIARAERDGLADAEPSAARELAASAVAELLPQAASETPDNLDDQPWLRASLGEAYVALADWDNAAKWYGLYAAETYVNAFELASARRQLVEVWQIAPESPGGEGALVRLLDFAISSKPGGIMQLTKAAQAQLDHDEGLVAQSILDPKSRPYGIEWLRNGFVRARSVAGVFDEGRKNAYGTAFLIAGRTLHPSLGDEGVALTAAHVVSTGGMLTASEAILRFEELDSANNEFEVESLFVSPPTELDFCVLRLKRPSKELSPTPVRSFDKFPDRIEDLGASARSCSTIGHPSGRELAVSLANSEILDLGYKRPEQRQRVFMRYTTSTEGGNSGGPVYDKDWNAIGLHRAGIRSDFLDRGIPCLGGKPGTHVANEGVALKSIAEEFRAGWMAPVVVAAAGTSSQSAPHDVVDGASKWAMLEAAILSRETTESTISNLFDEMAPDDFPAEDGTFAAKVVATDAIVPEAANVMDQFWYGGAVALSKAYRLRRQWQFAQSRARNGDGLTFVTEGDSWFQYPRPGVRDVIDHLGDSYQIYCRAIAGTLFEDMFADTAALMAAIKEYRPEGVLLSGGGNDLLGSGRVAAYVLPYREGVSTSELLNPVLDDKINLIVKLFDQLVDRALNINPKLMFFVHGYDQAMPKRGGGWLNGPLKSPALGYETLASQKLVVAQIVDRFNDRLQAFAAKHPGVVHYVDCRGVVGANGDDWYDELHPRSPGFGKIAAQFNHAIRRAFKDHPAIKRDLRNLGRGVA